MKIYPWVMNLNGSSKRGAAYFQEYIHVYISPEIAPISLMHRCTQAQATRISWPSIIWIIFLLHRDYMQRVLFVAELEALHMSSSLPAFQNCNKEGLVRSLWRNHAQEPRVNRGETSKDAIRTVVFQWKFHDIRLV